MGQGEAQFAAQCFSVRIPLLTSLILISNYYFLKLLFLLLTWWPLYFNFPVEDQFALIKYSLENFVETLPGVMTDTCKLRNYTS